MKYSKKDCRSFHKPTTLAVGPRPVMMKNRFGFSVPDPAYQIGDGPYRQERRIIAARFRSIYGKGAWLEAKRNARASGGILNSINEAITKIRARWDGKA